MADQNTEDVIVKVKIDGSSNTVSEVKNIKSEIKSLQSDLIKAQQEFGNFSPQAIKIAKSIGSLKDNIADANALSKKLGDGSTFESLNGAVGSVAAGFSALTGAAALFGAEGQDVQKTLLKVQGALALSQGLQGLKDARENFQALGGVIKNNVAGSFSTLKGAIIATGIGALVVAIGALIANWDSVKSSLDKVFPSLKEAGGLFNRIKEIAFGVGNTILQFVVGPIKAIVKAVQGDFKGAIAELKAGADVVGNFQKGVDDQRASAAAEARKARLEQEIKEGEDSLAIAKARGEKTLDAEKELSKKRQELLSDDAEKLREEKTKLAVLEATEEKRLEDERKKREEDARKRREEAAKKRAEEAKKRAEDEKKIQQEIDEELAAAGKDEFAKELLELEKNYEERKKIIQKNNGDLVDLNKLYALQIEEVEKKRAESVLAAEEASQKSKLDAALKANEELTKQNKISEDESKSYVDGLKEQLTSIVDDETLSLEERSEKLDQFQNDRIEQQDLTDSELTELSGSYAQARLDIAQREEEGKDALRSAASNALKQFASIAGEQTVAGKALAVAATTIDTYVSASKTYAALVGVGGPVGPVIAAFAAAGAIATGIKRVKDIVAVKVPGKGDGGAGSIAASAGSAAGGVAAASAVQQAQGTALNADTINQLGNKAYKSYVLESDVASAGANAKRVEDTASV
jgi:hypothetical protein